MTEQDKYPWFKFHPAAWMVDPNLSLCSPETRGIWIDMMCSMHESARSGKISGTIKQLARSCRCSPDELERAVEELNSTKTADVTECNGSVTIINRRMYGECISRESTRQRVKKHRSKGKEKIECNGSVTVQNKEVRIKNNIYTGQNDIVDKSFERFWNLYDYKFGRQDTYDYWSGKKKLKNGKKITEESRKEVFSMLGAYVKNTNKNGVYPSRKHPKTFLYNSCWLDEIPIKAAGTKISDFKIGSGGYYTAYCSKCGEVMFPNNTFQLRESTRCCGVELSPTKPSTKEER